MEELQESKTGAPDCFVVIDIENLAVENMIRDPAVGRWPSLQKTILTRKGSQRQQGETKVVEEDTAMDKPVCPVLVVGEKEHGGQLRAEAVLSPGRAGRRLGKRPSVWLGPRRVLFVFATMSSMGTLVLLYLTLSISKMTGADLDSQ